MTRTLSFNKQARSEIQEAAHYYGLESPTLRIAFLNAVDAALAQLLAYPEAAPVARGTIRRKLLRAFPKARAAVLIIASENNNPLRWHNQLNRAEMNPFAASRANSPPTKQAQPYA